MDFVSPQIWNLSGIYKFAMQHNTTQHNTTQHNTTQHNTTQHNTTQHYYPVVSLHNNELELKILIKWNWYEQGYGYFKGVSINWRFG